MASRLRRALTATAVAIISAIPLSSLGLALGQWYVNRYWPDAELEGVVPPFLGWFAGVCGGIAVGVWWSASRADAPRPWTGAASTFLLLPLALVGSWPMSHALGLPWWPVALVFTIGSIGWGRSMAGRGTA